MLAGCSKANAIELSVVPNQSMVTGKAIVIDVKTEPVISIDPNSIEISGGESWVENGVIKFKATEPGQYTMKVTQDNVTSNTITIPLNTSSAVAKNETQSTSQSSQSTTSKSSTQSSTQANRGSQGTQGQTNQTTPTYQAPTQNTTPTAPTAPSEPSSVSDPVVTTPSVDPEPTIPETPVQDPEPTVSPEETPTPVETPAPTETPSVETPAATPEQITPPASNEEEDPSSTVQDTSMSVDQVYEDQRELIANKTPITVDGVLPEALVTNGSGKEVQVLWNEELNEYIVLEGFTIPFGGCNAQVSGTLSRNADGQLVLSMTYISTDDVPKTGGTGYHDVTASTQSNDNRSAIDLNTPTPHPEPGTGN